MRVGTKLKVRGEGGGASNTGYKKQCPFRSSSFVEHVQPGRGSIPVY